MHWLRLFFGVYMLFAIPTVAVMFWFCKRAAVVAGIVPTREKVNLGALSPNQA